MKKTLLFTLALIAVGCSEPIPRNLDELVEQGDTYLDRETMRGYTGPVFRFHPSDTTQVVYTAILKDGILDGPEVRYYHETGQLGFMIIYKDGVEDGPSEAYYENGQLWERGVWNVGNKCGEWLEDGEETVTYDPCPPDLEGGS